jgi:hypothetical protein
MRYVLTAALAFTLGSASIALAGPVVSGFVGLIDASGNTAKINAAGALSVQEESGKEPVNQTFFAPTAGCSTGCASSDSYTVPAGKRLVITDVSGIVRLDGPGGKLAFVGLQFFQSGPGFIFPNADWFASPSLVGTNFGLGSDFYNFSGQTEIRVNEGLSVRAVALGTTGTAQVAIRGYLIASP